MPEPVYIFWALVAFLAVAAAWNHGWHHARESHLTRRLARKAVREPRGPSFGVQMPVPVENDSSGP